MGVSVSCEVSMVNFRAWADRAEIPWRAIKPHLDDVLGKARSLWREAIEDLPMNEVHKKKLKKHWGSLHQDFRIK